MAEFKLDQECYAVKQPDGNLMHASFKAFPSLYSTRGKAEGLINRSLGMVLNHMKRMEARLDRNPLDASANANWHFHDTERQRLLLHEVVKVKIVEVKE